MHYIEADYLTLMRQAPETVHEYFHKAIKSIDDVFGNGYAKAHPELVAAFFQASCSEFGNSVLCQTLQDHIGEITMALNGLSNAVTYLKPD